VVLSVLGTGGAATTIAVTDGTKTIQRSGVTLPWSVTLTDHPSAAALTAESEDGSSAAEITCQIVAPGKGPVTNTSTGSNAVVGCSVKP
jgi:hypothetical protein